VPSIKFNVCEVTWRGLRTDENH